MAGRRHKVVINRECSLEDSRRLIEFMTSTLDWEDEVDFVNFSSGAGVQMVTATEEDVQVKCVGCGQEFTFTVREQQFYEEKGFQVPRRCPGCRIQRRKPVTK